MQETFRGSFHLQNIWSHTRIHTPPTIYCVTQLLTVQWTSGDVCVVGSKLHAADSHLCTDFSRLSSPFLNSIFAALLSIHEVRNYLKGLKVLRKVLYLEEHWLLYLGGVSSLPYPCTPRALKTFSKVSPWGRESVLSQKSIRGETTYLICLTVMGALNVRREIKVFRSFHLPSVLFQFHE